MPHDRADGVQYWEQRSHRGPMPIDPKKDRAHEDSDQQRTSLATRIEEYLRCPPD
jgi:hypothetical protein